MDPILHLDRRTVPDLGWTRAQRDDPVPAELLLAIMSNSRRPSCGRLECTFKGANPAAEGAQPYIEAHREKRHQGEPNDGDR